MWGKIKGGEREKTKGRFLSRCRNDGNFAKPSASPSWRRDVPPLFSFLKDGSRLVRARDPVYLSRPINIGPSLGTESSGPGSSPPCAQRLHLADAESFDREKSPPRK